MEDIEKLQIIYQSWNKEDRKKKAEFIEYELYETNYVAAMRRILHNALNQKEWIAENENRIFKSEKRNILAFIGGRGSGKTTAMDEFCRILKSMDNEENGKWWINYVLEPEDSRKLEEDEFKFYVVQPIDASLLGEEDDLFELILVNIFRNFEKDVNHDSNYVGQAVQDINEAISLFQEIFKEYHATQNDKLERIQSSISLFHLISGSYAIQEKVARFIDKLLSLKKRRYKYEYIVIAIDDLDLNLTYGYKMLEVLQKYFSYYKIIILAAIDYEQMSLVCEEHFEKHMPNTTKKNRGILRNEYVRKLSNDYMTKIFPFSQRMYMPDFKSIMKNICILENRKEVPVKNYIMVKIAQKMRIYYDACGLKWHFCELDTIRELVSYNNFLDSLLFVDFNKLASLAAKKKFAEVHRIWRKYDQNYEQFHRDIVIRLAQNTLTPQQKEIFLELTKRDLERRAMYFASMDITNNHDSNIRLTMEAIDEQNYTYGYVLERIYDWGRKYFEVKPLINCIMASITSEMTREYLNYYYTIDEDSKERAKKRLLGFLGNSPGNEWCGSALPKVKIIVNNAQKTVAYGYMKQGLQQFISVDIKMNLLDRYSVDMHAEKRRDIIHNWMKNEEIVETLECINLFFVKKTNSGFENISFKGRIGLSDSSDVDNGAFITVWSSIDELIANGANGEKATDKVGFNLEISGDGDVATLDIMSFIARSIDYETQKQKIQENIIAVLSDSVIMYFEKKKKKISERLKREISQNVKEVVEEQSLFSKYMKRNKTYEVAFPFYNLDMSYNIWKRARRKFCNQVVEEEQVYQAILNLLAYIKELLENEERFYNRRIKTSFNYLENFSDCPYVQAIEKLRPDGIVAQRLIKIFRMVTTGTNEPEIARD